MNYQRALMQLSTSSGGACCPLPSSPEGPAKEQGLLENAEKASATA